jgi:hypothetical protein
MTITLLLAGWLLLLPTKNLSVIKGRKGSNERLNVQTKVPRYTKCRPGADFSRKKMMLLCMGRQGTLPDPPGAAARPGERLFDARTRPPCCSTEPTEPL